MSGNGAAIDNVMYINKSASMQSCLCGHLKKGLAKKGLSMTFEFTSARLHLVRKQSSEQKFMHCLPLKFSNCNNTKFGHAEKHNPAQTCALTHVADRSFPAD